MRQTRRANHGSCEAKVGYQIGENLGALVDPFETFLGFGDRFNRSDPKFLCAGRMKGDAHALPAIFHAKHRAGQDAAETQILLPLRSVEKTVGLGRSKEIDDRFDAHGDGLSREAA